MSFVFDYPPQGIPATSRHIRDQLNALGETNFTNDLNLPVNPRPGMLRVYQAMPTSDQLLQMWVGASWRTIAFVSTSGGAGAQRTEQSFGSSTLWTFNHGLGRHMQVYCMSSTGLEIYPTVAQPSVNSVTATHSIATAGKIILVG